MIRAIITDIEGTTSDISFVHNILFPYARERLTSYIREHQHKDDIQAILSDLRAEIEEPRASIERLTETLFSFMDQDRKSTALKALQGFIWRDGYQNGDFTGHLYPDVLPAFKQWQQQDVALYVYSSGSVAAQKLLFGYSDEGDITGLFNGYFDTHVGAKRDAQSYRNIAAHIGMPESELLFLSDIRQELDAAQQAGWHTVQLIRGEADTESVHRQVQRFDEITLEQFSL